MTSHTLTDDVIIHGRIDEPWGTTPHQLEERLQQKQQGRAVRSDDDGNDDGGVCAYDAEEAVSRWSTLLACRVFGDECTCAPACMHTSTQAWLCTMCVYGCVRMRGCVCMFTCVDVWMCRRVDACVCLRACIVVIAALRSDPLPLFLFPPSRRLHNPYLYKCTPMTHR